MKEPHPIDISADRNSAHVTIKWDNGEECAYPFDLLRNACPCAQCRGGHENMRSEPDEEVFTIPLMDTRATQMRDLKAVGNYAINIEWEDGHKHGIYNWHYLWALCQSMVERE